MNKKEVLRAWKPFLWSYDVDALDLSKDKERIITNVLNHGTHPATKLLFKVYPIEDIREIVKNPRPGEWDKKSLNFWSLMLKVKPRPKTRKFPKTN